MNDLKKIFNLSKKALTYHIKEDRICSQIAQIIQEKIDFTDDIFCIYQPSDGYVIGSANIAGGMANIPLIKFYELFKDKEKITEDEFCRAGL